MKTGDRIVVSAAVTGDGVQHRGWIADMCECMGRTFVTVKFDTPAVDGRQGCVISNPELIWKEEGL